MDFRSLTEAECGQANPLTKLSSHVTRDHAFAETHGQIFPSSSDQLVEQFLQETRAIPQTFRMDDLMREMHEIESQKLALPPVPASTVKDQLHDNAWAQQYIQDGKTFHDGEHEAVWAEILSQEQSQPFALEDFKVDEFFETPSSSLSIEQIRAKQLNESLDDPKFVYSKFMRFMKNVEDGDINLEGGKLTEEEAEAWSNEFLHTEAGENPQALADSWAKQHVKENNDDYNASFWNKLQEDIKRASESDDLDNPFLDELNTFYPAQKEYEFSEENPMFDINDPLMRGKELLNEGDFPSAVLCFEAAVKKEPDNVEAWLLLGVTQAENEQDPQAISALRRCIQLDPSNLRALMALAVSYTNESYYNQACHMLLNWLRSNPKYKDLVPSDLSFFGQVTSLLQPDEQKLVQELFIKAAQRNPTDIDYEVQCGLGVLFNLSGEFNKAVDCFRAALSVKPDDARLWNRLGATLANGSRAEEAVEAYHRALEIAPGFIRARYNVGITCINLNAYKEAAEHFLTALNQQARGKDVLNSGAISQMSDTIWITLKMCLALMNRADLRPAVDNKDLKVLNEAFDITD